MTKTCRLELLHPSSHQLVREIYVEAIENLGKGFYTKEQIQAWSSLAFLPGILDNSLLYGKGWVSLADVDNQVAAFAVRYPLDRLSLLYCRSCFARQGHATALLNQIQKDAKQDGQEYLRVEASSLSFDLLLKLGWTFIKPESIEIAGVKFERYLLELKLI